MIPLDAQARALAVLDAEAARPAPEFGTRSWFANLAHDWRMVAEAETRRADAAERELHDAITGPVLGEVNAERAAAMGEAIMVFRTPQAWADAGRAGCLVLDWRDPRLVGRLWLGQHGVIAEDSETARLLREAMTRADAHSVERAA